MTTLHKAPPEPTSNVVPCCGRTLSEIATAGDLTTNVDRNVTCKADELADLEMSPLLAALVASVTGPKRPVLIERLREIKAASGTRSLAEQADELLVGAGLPPHHVEDAGIPHGEPGHECIPPEVLMVVQDALHQVLDIVKGHRQRLLDLDIPEDVVAAMIANLHALLLRRML